MNVVSWTWVLWGVDLHGLETLQMTFQCGKDWIEQWELQSGVRVWLFRSLAYNYSPLWGILEAK